MNAIQINFADFVQIHNHQAITTSEFIAQAFGKRHADVLRKIDELLTQVPDYFNKRNFAFIEKTAKVGFGERQDRVCELTKDGFMLLVMGFTGKAAMQIKIAYIEAFNAMAEKLSGSLKKALTDKTTPEERTGLRQAVNALVGKKHIPYNEAYHLIHQRFNVEHIDQLNAEQISQAVEYVHRMTLNGEVLDKPTPPDTIAITAEECIIIAQLLLKLKQSCIFVGPVQQMFLKLDAMSQYCSLSSIFNGDTPKMMRQAHKILTRADNIMPLRVKDDYKSICTHFSLYNGLIY